FGQCVVGRLLGDAHVRRSGKLKTAADHRAMQNSYGRHLAKLNFFERSVPEPGMCDTLGDIALFQLREIKAGGEMLTFSGDQHGTDAVRQRRKELLDPDNGLVVERVTLLRSVKPQNGNRTLTLRNERRRKPDRK